jgi:hypothetical protein
MEPHQTALETGFQFDPKINFAKILNGRHTADRLKRLTFRH